MTGLLLCQPPSLLLLLGGIYVCVCVCVGVCLPSEEGGGKKKKSLRDAGRWRGALARYLLPDWLALSIPQSYGFFFSFLTEKNVFFEPRCSADREKAACFLTVRGRTPGIFCFFVIVDKISYLATYGFSSWGRRRNKSGRFKRPIL